MRLAAVEQARVAFDQAAPEADQGHAEVALERQVVGLGGQLQGRQGRTAGGGLDQHLEQHALVALRRDDDQAGRGRLGGVHGRGMPREIEAWPLEAFGIGGGEDAQHAACAGAAGVHAIDVAVNHGEAVGIGLVKDQDAAVGHDLDGDGALLGTGRAGGLQLEPGWPGGRRRGTIDGGLVAGSPAEVGWGLLRNGKARAHAQAPVEQPHASALRIEDGQAATAPGRHVGGLQGPARRPGQHHRRATREQVEHQQAGALARRGWVGFESRDQVLVVGDGQALEHMGRGRHGGIAGCEIAERCRRAWGTGCHGRTWRCGWPKAPQGP